jgi:hypothetical protein
MASAIDATVGRLVYRETLQFNASGRRLSDRGKLTGALISPGYFSAVVCIGTPARSFELVVDTGSSITSVPCHTCQNCGEHRSGIGGRFDERTSRTAERVHCPTRGVCEQCTADGAGDCNFNVGYVEGSAIHGYVVRDVMHLWAAVPAHSASSSPSNRNGARSDQPTDGGSSSAPPAAAVAAATPPVYFGCQTHESGKFRSQPADGILGLQTDVYGAGARRATLPSVVQALVATRQGAANTFSLCLGERIGLLLLAGHSGGSRALLARPDGATIGSMVAKATERFTLHVRDVKVGTATGPALNSAIISERRQNRRWPRSHAWQRASPLRFHSLRLPVSAYNPAVVDSGTSFFFASTRLWRALHLRLRQHHPSLRRVGFHRACARMTPAELSAMPTIALVLDGPEGSRPLLLRPAHYMVEYPLTEGDGGEGDARHVNDSGGGDGGSWRLSSNQERMYPNQGGSWWHRSWGRRFAARDERRDERHYCADIFNNGHKGTVLGASVLRQREVLFDMGNGTIAFVDADCARLTPRTAALRHAYAFAPCGEQYARG